MLEIKLENKEGGETFEHYSLCPYLLVYFVVLFLISEKVMTIFVVIAHRTSLADIKKRKAIPPKEFVCIVIMVV